MRQHCSISNSDDAVNTPIYVLMSGLCEQRKSVLLLLFVLNKHDSAQLLGSHRYDGDVDEHEQILYYNFLIAFSIPATGTSFLVGIHSMT